MDRDQLFEKLVDLPQEQQLRVLYRLYGFLEDQQESIHYIQKLVSEFEKDGTGMTCPRCENSEIKPSDKYCAICGLKLEREVKSC